MNTHVRDNLSYLKGTQVDSDTGAGRTFTNTSYLDLDALTGGAGTLTAVSVSCDTDTLAIVHVGAEMTGPTTGNILLSYRVSGATTVASSDTWAFNHSSAGIVIQAGITTYQSALNAGTNAFEAQARVTAGTGTLSRVWLEVEPS
jgi:hypothetical protein